MKKRKIIKAKNDLWEKYIKVLEDVIKFWQFTKRMTNGPPTPLAAESTIIQNRLQINDHHAKANLFLNQFCPLNNTSDVDSYQDFIEEITEAGNT